MFASSVHEENVEESGAASEAAEVPTLQTLSHFLHFLAYTYLTHNRTEHALILFNVLRNVCPDDGQIALSMGYALWKLGYTKKLYVKAKKYGNWRHTYAGRAGDDRACSASWPAPCRAAARSMNTRVRLP